MNEAEIRADERARVVLRLQLHAYWAWKHGYDHMNPAEYRNFSIGGLMDAASWLADEMEHVNEGGTMGSGVHDANVPAGTDRPRTITPGCLQAGMEWEQEMANNRKVAES